MDIPIMFAHGENLLTGLLFLLLAGSSSVVCFFVAAYLDLSGKSGKGRIWKVSTIWLLSIVLSLVLANVIVHFLRK